MRSFILIGCGSWGARWYNTFIPEVRDAARCVAVVDTDKSAADRAARALGLNENCVYTDTRSALADHKADFAAVAVSIPAHLPVIRDILIAQPGCHILSEKPVAGTMEDCLEIEKLVNKAGIKCAFTFSHRYEQDKQTLESVLASGRYGKLNSITGRLIVKKPPEGNADESLLINGGVHYIDMLRAYAQSEFKKVFADIWTCDWPNRGSVSHNAFMQAEMRNGVRTAFEFVIGSSDNRNTWCSEYFRAECENACLELDEGQLFACYTDADGGRHRERLELLPGAHWKHDLIIRSFIKWIEGEKEPDISLNNSMKSMEFLYAAVQSAKSGLPVE